MALDLFVHQMAGFNGEKARSLFDIPEGWEPVAMMAIGYLGDPQTLPESLREQELTPRIRKPLTEFILALLIEGMNFIEVSRRDAPSIGIRIIRSYPNSATPLFLLETGIRLQT